MKAHTISFLNFKGGCTKTTSTCGLGAALAHLGDKVLIVDLDPQSHVGAHFGVDEEQLEFGVDYVLTNRKRKMSSVIQATSDSNLFIAPSKRSMTNARHEFERRAGRDQLLWNALQEVVGDFDYILIDTPPDEGVLSINALYACQHVIAPTLLDKLSLTGLESLLGSIDNVQAAYRRDDMNILGVLVGRFDARLKRRNESNSKELKEYFGNRMLKTRIRTDEDIEAAQSAGKSIIEFNIKSKGAEDFISLAKEVRRKLK